MSEPTNDAASKAGPELLAFIDLCGHLYGKVRQNGRIEGIERLFRSFDRAADICRSNASSKNRRALGERVNELAVAKILSSDSTLSGIIQYEPKILPSGRRIDFVAESSAGHRFVEVKSVWPSPDSSKDSWDKYVSRKQHLSESNEFIANPNAMGGELFNAAFASRVKFLEYALHFEERLAEALAEHGGAGILVYCGTGSDWNISDLQDFADFYHEGRHRSDDRFSKMETHALVKRDRSLLRNISWISCLTRTRTCAEARSFVYNVRGPKSRF